MHEYTVAKKCPCPSCAKADKPTKSITYRGVVTCMHLFCEWLCSVNPFRYPWQPDMNEYCSGQCIHTGNLQQLDHCDDLLDWTRSIWNDWAPGYEIRTKPPAPIADSHSRFTWFANCVMAGTGNYSKFLEMSVQFEIHLHRGINFLSLMIFHGLEFDCSNSFQAAYRMPDNG